MKKVLLLIGIAVSTLGAKAQIKTPAPSPKAKVEQVVGLTDVTIEYSRPGMRGRTIFGNLVPYGKLWRTGANSNTTVEFSTDVVVAGKDLKAGKYAIYTKPTAKSWEVLFYTITDNWGVPKQWDESKVALSVKAEVYPIPMKIETFTITVDDLTSDSAHIGIMWEKTYVGIPFKTPANTTVLNNIKTAMAGAPSQDDYYTAAVYLSSTDQDTAKAAEYMNKAMELNKEPKFWQLRQQSLILAKTGDKKGAIAAAEKSLSEATKAGNKDYIKLNTDSIKEWKGN